MDYIKKKKKKKMTSRQNVLDPPADFLIVIILFFSFSFSDKSKLDVYEVLVTLLQDDSDGVREIVAVNIGKFIDHVELRNTHQPARLLDIVCDVIGKCSCHHWDFLCSFNPFASSWRYLTSSASLLNRLAQLTLFNVNENIFSLYISRNISHLCYLFTNFHGSRQKFRLWPKKN